MALPTRAQRVLRSLRQAVPSGVVLGRRSAGNGPVEFIELDEIIGAQLDAISSVQGSILYRNATDWVALAPGTSGQVLITQGAAANPIWGSAGGANWWFDPPAAADFGTTVTEGSASLTAFVDDTDIGLSLTALPGGNDNLYAKLQAPPSFPFTITAHFVVTERDGLICGIVLRASGTGLRTVFGPDATGAKGALIIRQSTGTTFNNNVAVATEDLFQASGIWLRAVVTSGTDIVYEISGDGKNFITWQTNIAAAQVSGLDQIGFGVTRRGASSNACSIVCDHWTVA